MTKRTDKLEEMKRKREEEKKAQYGDRKRPREKDETQLASPYGGGKAAPPKKKKLKASGLPKPSKIPAPSGDRKIDRNLHLYFVAMGQGDCTVLVTPEGKVFLFDIGSSASESKIVDNVLHLYDLLMQDNILGQNRQLEGVVITHSDADHNNHLWLLNYIKATTQRIYHSNSFNSYAKLGRGGSNMGLVNDVMNNIRATPEDYRVQGVSYTSSKSKPTPCPTFGSLFDSNIVKITDNYLSQPFRPPVAQYRAMMNTARQISTLNTTQPASIIPDINTYPQSTSVFSPYYQDGQGMVIYQETNCTIRILVGNYRNYYNAFKLSDPEYYLNSKSRRAKWGEKYKEMTTKNVSDPRTANAKDINEASIVILITHTPKGQPEENYVICGDATEEPLFMIQSEYPALSNITILQTPHHGSDSHGSNSSSFFKKMKPQIAVYSCPFYSVQHHHPRKSSVENMMDAMDEDDRYLSNFGCWTGSDNDVKGKKGVENEYYQYLKAPYRIYMTGWMRDGYYHYQSPLTTASNHPTFWDKNTYAKHTIDDWSDDSSGDETDDSSDDSSDEENNTNMSDDSSDEENNTDISDDSSDED